MTVEQTISDRKSTRHITQQVSVWSRYEIELGDNGMRGDQRLTLYLAPAVGAADEYFYLATNGDPLLVGWLDGTDVVLADDAGDLLADEPWIAEKIKEEGFVLT